MLLDDAATMLAGLKAAFPRVDLDEEQTEVLLREMALLHDPSILAAAVANLIQREEKFPPIARIRSAYRSVAEASALEQRALRASEPEPKPDSEIPVWVQVWEWHRRRTLTERQAANTKMGGPVEERVPVMMRYFPQCNYPPEESFSREEYEALEAGWRAEGCPSVSAQEVLGGVA